MVQLSHPCMTTGETIALTRQTFVREVRSLFFNKMPGFMPGSFPSKEQASFNFMAAVPVRSDFGAQENTIFHHFHLFPFYLPDWWDWMPCIMQATWGKIAPKDTLSPGFAILFLGNIFICHLSFPSTLCNFLRLSVVSTRPFIILC